MFLGFFYITSLYLPGGIQEGLAYAVANIAQKNEWGILGWTLIHGMGCLVVGLGVLLIPRARASFVVVVGASLFLVALSSVGLIDAITLTNRYANKTNEIGGTAILLFIYVGLFILVYKQKTA